MLAAWSLVLLQGIVTPALAAEPEPNRQASPWDEKEGGVEVPAHRTPRHHPDQEEPGDHQEGGEGKAALAAGTVTAVTDAAAVVLATILRLPLGCIPGFGLLASVLFSTVLVGTAAGAPLAGWAGLGTAAGRRTAVLPVAGPAAGVNAGFKLLGGVFSGVGAFLHGVAGLLVLGWAGVATAVLVFGAATVMGNSGDSSGVGLLAGIAGYLLIISAVYLASYAVALLGTGLIMYGMGLASYAAGGGLAAALTAFMAAVTGRPLEHGERSFNVDVVEVPDREGPPPLEVQGPGPEEGWGDAAPVPAAPETAVPPPAVPAENLPAPPADPELAPY